MFVLYNSSTKQFMSQRHQETHNLLDALSFSTEQFAKDYCEYKDLPDGFEVLHQQEAMSYWISNTRENVGDCTIFR